MKAKHKMTKFKLKADKHIEKLNDMIEKMPFKGNKEEDSQQVCLMNALRNFEITVNGLEPEDFKEDENS